MSTPIDQVRELVRYRRLRYEARDETRLTDALASVLRDAERFKALERAITDDKIFVSAPDPHDDDLWAPHDGTLSELADRLRETK